MIELTGWTFDRTASFPKSQRFTFGQRLDNFMLDAIELVITARFAARPEKMQALRQLNLTLEKLRVLWSLSSTRGWITLRQLFYVHKVLDEIGQQAGAWCKSLEK